MGFKVIFLCLLMMQVHGKRMKSSLVETIEDSKDFKKMIKSNNNVVVLYLNKPKGFQSMLDVFRDTADLVRGQSKLAVVDCMRSKMKDICDKLNIPPAKAYVIKHFKDGIYNKDYDRSETVLALNNFLHDPTTDLPWKEDPYASEIFHLQNAEALSMFLSRSPVIYQKAIVMFYASWCDTCNAIKPEYVEAAKDLWGEVYLAAIDVSYEDQSKIRELYNITAVPALLYYEKGRVRFEYNGPNNIDSMMLWMRESNSINSKPTPPPRSYPTHPAPPAPPGPPLPPAAPPKPRPPVPPPPQRYWKSHSNVIHLTEETFHDVMRSASRALVVFHAPWCKFCHQIKIDLEKAATLLKLKKIDCVIASVDVVEQENLAHSLEIREFPTIKYFEQGQYQFDSPQTHSLPMMVALMTRRQGMVQWLDMNGFLDSLLEKRHALVVFEGKLGGGAVAVVASAARHFWREPSTLFAAVSCVKHPRLCAAQSILKDPTVNYYSYYHRRNAEFTGKLQEMQLVNFMHSQIGGDGKERKVALTNQEAGFGANVLLVDDDKFVDAINSSKPTFIMFYATWCGHCVTAKPAFSKLATTLKKGGAGTGGAVAVAVNAADNPHAADVARVDALPSMRLYANGRQVAEYTGDRSHDDMLRFLQEQHAARRTAAPRDEL